MIEAKLKKILSKSLSLPVKDIKRNISQTNEPKWDSINSVKILLEIEREFKFRFGEKEFNENYNLSKLTKLVKNKNASK